MNSYEIRSDLNLIIYQPANVLTANDIYTFLENVVQDPEYKTDMLEFIDLSFVKKWEIQYNDFQAILSSQVNKGTKAKKIKKAGILAITDIAYGVARMYQSIAQSYGIEIYISRNRDEVLDFLDLSKDIKLVSIATQ